MIVIGVLGLVPGVGSAWLWQDVARPSGGGSSSRTQGEGDSLQGWMLRHHVVRPEFSEPNKASAQLRQVSTPPTIARWPSRPIQRFRIANERDIAAGNEMARLGSEALPVVIEALGMTQHRAADGHPGLRWIARSRRDKTADRVHGRRQPEIRGSARGSPSNRHGRQRCSRGRPQ